MKHQLSIVKSSLAAALLLFVGAGAAQAQTQTDTQKVYFAETGSTTAGTTFQRSLGSEFMVDVIYEDNVADRSVVSFNVHWDDSAVEFGGVVAGSIKAVEDRDPAACQVSSAVPAAVSTAGDNTKIVFSTLPTDIATEEGDDGDTDTDRSVNPTWAQICGDVFDLASGEKTKVATLKFTVKDVENYTPTKLGLSQAHGGDFAVAAFEGTALTITEQEFTLNVDGVGVTSLNDLLMIIRYVLLGEDTIANSDLVAGTGIDATAAPGIKTTIAGGITALNVDGVGVTSLNDLLMIVRYVLLGEDTIADADLVAGTGLDESAAPGIKSTIKALL